MITGGLAEYYELQISSHLFSGVRNTVLPYSIQGIIVHDYSVQLYNIQGIIVHAYTVLLYNIQGIIVQAYTVLLYNILGIILYE